MNKIVFLSISFIITLQITIFSQSNKDKYECDKCSQGVEHIINKGACYICNSTIELACDFVCDKCAKDKNICKICGRYLNKKDKDIFLITFTTKDGFRIFGSFYYPKDGSQKTPLIIMLHMMARDRNTWNDLAEELQSKGYAVITFDLRGHGESIYKNGTKVDLKKLKPQDFKKIIEDIEVLKSGVEIRGPQSIIPHHNSDKVFDTTKIILIGASIGANVSLNYAVKDLTVRGVVLLSPGLNYRNVLTLDAIVKYGSRPILLAASENDESFDDVKKLADKAKGKKTVLLYKKAGHGTNMFGKEDTPGELKTKITEFVKEVFEKKLPPLDCPK